MHPDGAEREYVSSIPSPTSSPSPSHPLEEQNQARTSLTNPPPFPPTALHFKLAVATDTAAATRYEDTEFQYTPRLDRNRDRDLLDILPDYLTEEITFSRQHAAKFYARVVETLTKRVEGVRGADEEMG